VDEEIKKGASFQWKKKPTAASPEEPKRKDAPKMEVNVISLEDRVVPSWIKAQNTRDAGSQL